MSNKDLYGNRSRVKELNPTHFQRLKNGKLVVTPALNKKSFVVFYASWCGHCKNMVQSYIELANQLKGCVDGGTVFIGAFNCANNSSPGYTQIAKLCGVSSYPTIKYIKPDGMLIRYEGGREPADFINFLRKH